MKQEIFLGVHKGRLVKGKIDYVDLYNQIRQNKNSKAEHPYIFGETAQSIDSKVNSIKEKYALGKLGAKYQRNVAGEEMMLGMVNPKLAPEKDNFMKEFGDYEIFNITVTKMEL